MKLNETRKKNPIRKSLDRAVSDTTFVSYGDRKIQEFSIDFWYNMETGEVIEDSFGNMSINRKILILYLVQF